MKKIIAILIVSLFLSSIASVYASDGDVIWAKSYDSGGIENAQGVATDSYNNVIVTGYANNNYLTVKYDPSGNVIWAKSYDSGGTEYAQGVATDSYNNVIVTGYANNNYLTVKYDPNGNVIWAKSYDSGNDDEAYGIATDSNNNVIVTGFVVYGPNMVDYLTVKYDPNGEVLWAKNYDRENDDEAYGIATDSNNNVLVTGAVFDGSHFNYLTLKYDPNGNVIWAKTYDSGINDVAVGVATDSYNNVIVTGFVGYFFNGSFFNGLNYLTVKYDPNGNVIWAKTYDSGESDEAQGVATDSYNNVIVTGSSKFKYFTIKYGGIPPKNKSPPMQSIMKILGLLKE